MCKFFNKLFPNSFDFHPNKLTAKLYYNTRIDAVYKHESELEKQKYHTISNVVSEIATSRGISLRGWMSKKKKSDY